MRLIYRFDPLWPGHALLRGDEEAEDFNPVRRLNPGALSGGEDLLVPVGSGRDFPLTNADALRALAIALGCLAGLAGNGVPALACAGLLLVACAFTGIYLAEAGSKRRDNPARYRRVYDSLFLMGGGALACAGAAVVRAGAWELAALILALVAAGFAVVTAMREADSRGGRDD